MQEFAAESDTATQPSARAVVCGRVHLQGEGRERRCRHGALAFVFTQAVARLQGAGTDPPGLEVHLCLVVGDALRAVHGAVRVLPGDQLEQVFQQGAQLPGCGKAGGGRKGLEEGKAGGSLPSQELPSALLNLC